MARVNPDFSVKVALLIVSFLVMGFIITASAIAYAPKYDPDTHYVAKAASEPEVFEKWVTSTTTQASTLVTYPPAEPVFYARCYTNNDCGFNGTFTTAEYTCLDGDIYRLYMSFRCANPGTMDAECIGRERKELLEDCGDYEHCLEREPYCQYTGDVDKRSSLGRPDDAKTVLLDYEYEVPYGDYVFSLDYIYSESSQPKGAAIYVLSPDGKESRIYCSHGKAIELDGYLIGLEKMYKADRKMTATIWIKEKV